MLDGGFSLALLQEEGAARYVVRVAKNATFRRAVLAGKAVRPGTPVPDATSGVCPAARLPGRHGRERPSGWSFRPAQVGSTLTGFLQTYFADEVMELLGVPKGEGWHLHGVVPLGYPRGKWGVGPRKPVHEVAARNSWQGALGFTVPEPLWPK